MTQNYSNMKEASIDIRRKDGQLFSISVVMPIWDKTEMDNTLSVNIPLFGLKTFAEDEVDADIAAKEVIKGFCLSADKFGRGLETELKLLGWSFARTKNKDSDIISMIYNVKNEVVDQIMQTGEQFADNLQLAS